MMRSEFLADVDLGEKVLKHGGRLPLHHHSLKALFTQLDVGQKFAAHHDAISDKTIVRMEIENIRNSGMLDIALRDWTLQT